MTDECWNRQKERLINHFGEKHYSREFCLLLAVECKSTPDSEFVHIVDTMIGSRPAHRPPLLQDFREARISLEKLRLQRDLHDAINTLNTSWPKGLQAYLAREFPGCRNIWEAIQVRKLQIQVAQANDPNYDPLLDQKWN